MQKTSHCIVLPVQWKYLEIGLKYLVCIKACLANKVDDWFSLFYRQRWVLENCGSERQTTESQDIPHQLSDDRGQTVRLLRWGSRRRPRLRPQTPCVWYRLVFEFGDKDTNDLENSGTSGLWSPQSSHNPGGVVVLGHERAAFHHTAKRLNRPMVRSPCVSRQTTYIDVSRPNSLLVY